MGGQYNVIHKEEPGRELVIRGEFSIKRKSKVINENIKELGREEGTLKEVSREGDRRGDSAIHHHTALAMIKERADDAKKPNISTPRETF